MVTHKHEANTDSERYDSLEIRCPRLGGEVTFKYCRVEGGELPCMRIVACWQCCIPVAQYLREILSPEQLERFVGLKPKERIATLVELIEAAKKDIRE
jgi:hypothetical protein